MKTGHVLLLLCALAALLAACDPSEREAASIYGNPPSLEEYRHSLGGYGFLAEQFHPREVLATEQEYETLAQHYRAEGLESLSYDERQSLLSVAQAAFLAHASTFRYSVLSDDGSGSEGASNDVATLEEIYQDRGVPTVTGRHMSGGAFSWQWSHLPARSMEAPNERVELIEFDPRDSGVLDYKRWERDGQMWTCATFTGEDEAWGMANITYLGRFGGYARGDPQGRDSIDGRAAYRFNIRGLSAWEDQTYWLDAETLWLRQYEFEDDGIRYTVKLEAVNEDIRIEPPDVDVECVEEQAE